MKKLDIAILTSSFPPYRGGMGTVAELDARQLVSLGHRVTVYSPGSPSSSSGAYAVKSLPGKSFGLASFSPAAAGLMTEYDLVVLHYPFYGAAEAVMFAKKINKKSAKLAVVYHMDNVGRGLRAWFFAAYSKLFLKKFLMLADIVLPTTIDYVQHGRASEAYAAAPEKFFELQIATDVQRFAPGQKHEELFNILNIDPNRRTLVFTGGLDRAHYFKGVPVLIKAMTMPELSDVQAVIIGDGELRPLFEGFVRANRLTDRVVFAGSVPGKNLPDYLRLADVFVFPSVDKSEAFGIAALEALACGVPVVTSDLAGVRTLVRNGQVGLTSPAGDAKKLAVAVASILSDEKKRQKMGQSGREMAVNEYSEPPRLEKWRQIIEKLFN